MDSRMKTAYYKRGDNPRAFTIHYSTNCFCILRAGQMLATNVFTTQPYSTWWGRWRLERACLRRAVAYLDAAGDFWQEPQTPDRAAQP